MITQNKTNIKHITFSTVHCQIHPACLLFEQFIIEWKKTLGEKMCKVLPQKHTHIVMIIINNT